MIKEGLYSALLVVILVPLQGVVFSNFDFGNYFLPYVYFLCVLYLPLGFSRLTQLSFAFIAGIFMDMFYSTPGLHASSMVLLSYIRPYILKIISPRDGYSEDMWQFSSYGNLWLLAYLGLSSLVFCTWHFVLESWSLELIWFSVQKALASTVVSTLFCFLLVWLAFPKKNEVR